MSRRGWKADVFEARVNNASSSQGVRWAVRSVDSASEVRPGPQNKLCDGLWQSLPQKGLQQQRAGTEDSATTGPRCGSGLWTDRSRTGAQAWRQTIAPSAHPGPRLWSGSEVPTLCRNGAGREAGERDQRHPPARRHRDRGWGGGARRGVAGGAGPGETQTSPRAGRTVAVTSRRVGALARARRRPYPCRGP